ncbi:MAG: diaminopimelate dehydrogenase, partial [Epulopiscium sp.]|nr:diaminopimelate dehydrogenase [Candidatus Epulonipiscium sp.]
MTEKIRIAIAGYGNIGKGVEAAIAQNEDMVLTAVFTRRNPESINIATKDAKVVNLADAASYKDDIDVMILCGGSATDLPVQVPEMAALFHTVDSFDTHAKIPEYFSSVDEVAKANGHVSIISVGWDPGMFSIQRLLGEAILPEGKY